MAESNVIEIGILAKNRASEEMRRFARDAEDLDRTTTKVFASIAGAAFAAEAAIIAVSTRAGMAADRLGDMGAKVGIAGTTLSEYEFALKRTDTSLDALLPGLKILASLATDSAAGNKTASETLKRWGVEATDASGRVKPLTELILEASDAIHRQSGEARQLTAATDLFGRSAVDAAAFLKLGREGIEAYIARSHELGGVMSEELIRSADEWDRSLDEVKTSLEGLANTLAERTLPRMTDLIEKMTEAITKSREWAKEHPTGAAFAGGAAEGGLAATAVIGGGAALAGGAAAMGASAQGAAAIAAARAMAANPALWAGAALAAVTAIVLGLKEAAESKGREDAQRVGEAFDWSKVPGGYLGAMERFRTEGPKQLPEVVVEATRIKGYGDYASERRKREDEAAQEAQWGQRFEREAHSRTWGSMPSGGGFAREFRGDMPEVIPGSGGEEEAEKFFDILAAPFKEEAEKTAKALEKARDREMAARMMISSAVADMAEDLILGGAGLESAVRSFMRAVASWMIRSSVQAAFGFASGGIVPSTLGIPGRDSVPALLTPGERVLSVAENRAFESGLLGSGRRTAEDYVIPGLNNVTNLTGTVQIVIPASPVLGQMDSLRAGHSIERSLANLGRHVGRIASLEGRDIR